MYRQSWCKIEIGTAQFGGGMVEGELVSVGVVDGTANRQGDNKLLHH